MEIDAAAIDEIIAAQPRVKKWPHRIAAMFEEECEAKFFREHRFLFLLGLMICLGTILVDLLVNHAMAREGAVLRAFASIPLTLVGLWAGARRKTRITALALGASPIAFIAVLAHLSTLLPPMVASQYLLAAALIVGIGNITLPFTLRGLAAFNIAAILAAIGGVGFGAPDEVAAIAARADYFVVLAIVAIATLPLAQRINRLHQTNFLMNLRYRLVSDKLFATNLALKSLAETDPLTGISNRRHFERLFDEHLILSPHETAARGDEAEWNVLMMIDLDHFKRFNDVHGHQSGDSCLVLAARALDRLIDEAGGHFARYGGEEFIAALRVRDKDKALALGEAARSAIANLLLSGMEEQGTLVTASIGVAIAPASARLPREELVEMADAALYSSKKRGRNRVEVVEAFGGFNDAGNEGGHTLETITEHG